jgi:hypothetical protein
VGIRKAESSYTDIAQFSLKMRKLSQRGQHGPFNMSSYKAVKGYSPIREVLLNKQMPPWHADRISENSRTTGRFQSIKLELWSIGSTQVAPVAKATTPRRLGQAAAQEDFGRGFTDFIVAPSQVMAISHGVVEYITNIVESPLAEDAWLRAAVIRPDNKGPPPRIVYLVSELQAGRDDLDSWLTGWAFGL